MQTNWVLAVIIPLEQQAGETLRGHCQVDEAQEVIVVQMELVVSMHKQDRYNLHYNVSTLYHC